MSPLTMTFACSGSKQPDSGKAGDPLYQLWRIEDKFTFRSELVYGVLYHEEQPRLVHSVAVSELEQQYPKQVQDWETRFAARWEMGHGDKGTQMGNPWPATPKDPATPFGKQVSSSSTTSESKRLFDDTPQKAEQDDAKKSKVSTDIFDIPSDEENDPFKGSVTARASAARSAKFTVPPGAMGPPPRPRFVGGARISAAASSALDDDDIEDSPTRGSSGVSRDQEALSSSPKKPATSGTSRIPIRDNSRPRIVANSPSLNSRRPTSGSGSMSSAPRTTSFPASSSSRAPNIGSRTPQVDANRPSAIPRPTNPGLQVPQVSSAVSSSITRPPSSRTASTSSVSQSTSNISSSTPRVSTSGTGSASLASQGSSTIPSLILRPPILGPGSISSAPQDIAKVPSSTSRPSNRGLGTPQARSNVLPSNLRVSTAESGSMSSAAQMRSIPGPPGPVTMSSRPQAAVPLNHARLGGTTLPRTPASRSHTMKSRQSSSAGDSSTAEDASSDEDIIVRTRSNSWNLAKKISGLQVSSTSVGTSSIVSGFAQDSRASAVGSVGGMRSDNLPDDGEASLQMKDESDPDALEVDEDSPDRSEPAILDSEEDDDEETDYFQIVSKVSEAAFAESQRELEEEDDEEPQPTQAKLPDGTPIYEDYSARLIKAYGDGVDSLVRVALDLTGLPCDRWVQKRQNSKACQFESLVSAFWLMMIGWDPLILKHLVHGNVPAQQKQDPELKKRLSNLRNLPLGIRIPSIYMQYLVDREGISPPPKVLLQILDLVEIYTNGLGIDVNTDKLCSGDIKSSVLATLVDTAFSTTVWSKATAQKGQRRYIEGPAQAETCLVWVAAARERLEGVPMDEPLARPWAECGYATYPNERLDQHAKHNSSNYLMNLTEAICKAKFASRYNIAQFVVHQIVHHTHAMYGEVLASRIALVYTAQGGGWCHFKAGVSHGGVDKAEPQYFTQRQKQLWKDADFIQRKVLEVKKIHERAELHREFQRVSAGQRGAIAEMFSGAQIVEEKLTKVKKEVETLAEVVKQEGEPLRKFMDFVSELRRT